jgi:hypothetical protein
MAKFHGKIGYVDSQERLDYTTPEDPEDEPEEIHTGVWEDVVTERTYYGDIIRESNQWSSADKANDNLSVNNRISIIADNFAYENFSAMRYVEWIGVRWKVSNVEIKRPRLILTLGGVYNGPTYVPPN